MTIVDYNYPLFKTTSEGLCCGCDMCYSTQLEAPMKKIGPHDLHCVCPPCMTFCFNETAYEEALSTRYPGYESYLPEHITQEQVDQLWKDLDDSYYNSPSTSPTNAEMHAYNGNLSHQHHHGAGDFIRTAGHHLSRLADQNRGTLMMAQAGLFPAGLAYSSMKNLAEPLAELREQIFPHKGPSNQEMHAYNGNMNFPIPGDNSHVPIPVIKHKKGPTTDPARDYMQGHKKQDPIKKDQPIKPGGRKGIQNPPVKHDVHYDPIKSSERYHPGSDLPVGITAQLEELERRSHKKGPTNQEMHASNGNIKIRAAGPMTKKEYERRQRRKVKRKATKKAKGVTVNIGNKKTIAKAPKGFKQAFKLEKLEARIARAYTKFLKYPSMPPPRLGSTGRAPTKLIHGWFKQTFSMAAPAVGSNTITNATEMIAFISPRMAAAATTPQNFYAPIAIGFATSSGVACNSLAGASSTNTLLATNFANLTAIGNEAGIGTLNPQARWVGGSVSLECRCPMSTTAPPYLFGGLLPDNLNAQGDGISTANQLNALTTTQIRNLPSTKELDGFKVTAIYIPDTPKALDFSGLVAGGTSSSYMPSTAIPYIGMSGCPTTATVTVLVNGWFEITQTTANADYASGWAPGPRCSSEDVFDNLSSINPVFAGVVNLGTSGARASVSGLLAALAEKPQVDVKAELVRLTKQITDLKLIIDEEEDEKYFDTPIQSSRNLSQSTIDLALALKDRLTPGSVTSKTSKIQAV